MVFIRGTRVVLVGFVLMVVGAGYAQAFLPDLTFGESCAVMLERALAMENVNLLRGDGCGEARLPDIGLEGELDGFKVSYTDRTNGLAVFMLYHYFENDRFTALMVGATLGTEALDAIAEASYGPYEECSTFRDGDYQDVTCFGATETAVVQWTSSTIHSSLTFIDLTRFDNSPGALPADTSDVAQATEGFLVMSFDARWEGNTLWVVGEVRNVSNRPAGVELQVIARDPAGRLVDVATFWPASINNIRPGSSYGFRHPVTNQRSATRVEVDIVGSEIW